MSSSSAEDRGGAAGMPANAPRRLYCDHAATSFPKPPEVLRAMTSYATEIGASAGRGGYAEARASAQVLKTCRERLNALFHGENPDHFVFTLNCTDGLNLAIKGVLRPAGGHVITTVMDHNSVLRPLNGLIAEGCPVKVTHLPVDAVTCQVDPDQVRRALRPETRLIALAHASNVTGTVQAVREIGQMAREAGVTYLVDAAQTAGHVPIDVQADCIDLLAFPGHKGLLGPLGTGAIYIRPGLERRLLPQRHGGTGSASERDVQPDFMPDRFESGSQNAIGIAGLSEGVAWLLKRTVQWVFEHDQMLCRALMEEVDGVDGLRYFGPQGIKGRIGVFSFQVRGIDPLKLSERLEREYGILTRAGLHCAPLAHRHLGTAALGGTSRASFGPFLTVLDVTYVADALSAMALENFSYAGSASRR